MAEFIVADINTYVGQDRKGEIVYNEDSIINGLLNLFMCVPRSRRFQPEYGSNLHNFLHEPVSQDIADDIKALVLQEIRIWQPYAEGDPLGTVVVPLPTKDGYYLDVSYYSKIDGIRNNITLRVLQTGLPTQG